MKMNDMTIGNASKVSREPFHFSVGGELWTLPMRRTAIKEACLELRLLGGRSLVGHAVEGHGWNPMVFLAEALSVEVMIQIPERGAAIFRSMCCKGYEVDKTMAILMMFVSRMEMAAMEALGTPSKKEYKGVLVGNWHPVPHLRKAFRDTIEFYVGGRHGKVKKTRSQAKTIG